MDLDESLRLGVQAVLRRTWPSFELRALRPLTGGRSGVTLLGECYREGLALDDRYASSVVVKAAPFGRKPAGRHDVLRQARLIAALESEPDVVVPRILATGIEPVHFYVMTCAVGEAVEPVLDAGTVALPPALVTERAVFAARMLAALHRFEAIPPAADGNEEPMSDLAGELDRWVITARAAEPAILAGGAELANRLAARLPREGAAPVLVHGDYRLGNIVFDGGSPSALIDWEIWGRTHPGVDLGWFLVFCDAELFPGIGAPVEGLPSSVELLQHYLDAGGHGVGDLAWFEAFGRFKMASIMAHNLRRHREGRHVDPFQEKLPATIARLLETGLEMLAG